MAVIPVTNFSKVNIRRFIATASHLAKPDQQCQVKEKLFQGKHDQVQKDITYELPNRKEFVISKLERIFQLLVTGTSSASRKICMQKHSYLGFTENLFWNIYTVTAFYWPDTNCTIERYLGFFELCILKVKLINYYYWCETQRIQVASNCQKRKVMSKPQTLILNVELTASFSLPDL